MIDLRYLIFFILILFGCSSKISENLLLGAWWATQEDSTYFEIYINEREFVFNHEAYGPIEYKYRVYDDSIKIFTNSNGRSKNWEIVQISDSSLILKSEHEEFILNKIILSEGYFDLRIDSIAFENFQENFIERYLRKRE
ncbi:hypothetical protein [Mongoliibacter ruber]|uniref:Lipocalin-like protein n=1 Tax=Mongoliibacter ruber TaxID=1750599 RepID=A0A2T0WLQ9_9BACT|nr:hypothetical protein [Mongoliibacter ruber]PRY87639.1 hypothetical protein CLW00_106266 [Mongoliibacter ruber]